MATFSKLPTLTGQPRVVLAEDEAKKGSATAKKENEFLATAPNSHGAVRASGKLLPIPEDVRRKVRSASDVVCPSMNVS